METPTPSFSEALDILRLKGAPLLHIVCSVIGLLAIASLVQGQPPSAVLADLIIGLGFPEATVSGALETAHAWLVADPRFTWFAFGTITLGVAIAWRYITGWKSVWSALEEAREDKSRLLHVEREATRADNETDGSFLRIRTDEMRAAELDLARTARD